MASGFAAGGGRGVAAADGGLYPAGAAWAGVCDRMADVSPLVASRRDELWYCMEA